MYQVLTSYQSKKKQGFTLIEIIVSLALFSVVITIAVGALLVLISSNRQLQNEQSVLSNLSFALDSMTREMRTGSSYFCAAGSSQNSIPNGAPGDIAACANGGGTAAFHGVVFDEGGRSITVGANNSRIAYFFNRSEGKIYRRLSGRPAQSIVSDGVFIDDAQFFVTGVSRTDNLQPKITIVLRAYNTEADALADTTGAQAYLIQTTVTQRSLDI